MSNKTAPKRPKVVDLEEPLPQMLDANDEPTPPPVVTKTQPSARHAEPAVAVPGLEHGATLEPGARVE